MLLPKLPKMLYNYILQIHCTREYLCHLGCPQKQVFSTTAQFNLRLNHTWMNVHSLAKETWLIFIAWNNTVPVCFLFLAVGDFRVIGLSNTLVEVSKHCPNEYQGSICHSFLFQLLILSHNIIWAFFVFMSNKALSMSMQSNECHNRIWYHANPDAILI